MSNELIPPPRSDKGRWAITWAALVMAAGCVVWIVAVAIGERGDTGVGRDLGLIFPFAGLDVLAVTVLGVWLLRPPGREAVTFFGRWLGKVLLFLGLSAAAVIFLFGTCFTIAAGGR